MDTSVLKNFAQESRRYLMDVVKKKIDYYLTSDSADIRAKKDLIDDLKKEIANSSKDQVIEKIAYTWFNRFCALRYMDVKQYSVVGVLTPASTDHTQPEILMEAKSGHIKEELGRKESRDQVIALLSGKSSASDPQNDAYKILLLMSCNYYHSIMPFLFEKVDDYTELLMPDDLLSEASIISKVREALSPENCENVEVIGWLYQFYISEKKDEVFAGLKNNKKITTENIPAATQLFTPNWIVRYLVENSLGRLWMLNRPNSNLISKMEYYIKPQSVETDFLKINGPEEIKICDPACGSGHILVYAFDLLYLMYEEEGVDPNEIPSYILKNNLFGIEIDKRAGELAAFALTMKAREKQRRYFRNSIQPNICVLENIHFEANEIKEYMDHIGRDLFTDQFQNTLLQFEEAKNFGSLIKPELSDVDNILALLDKKNVSGDLLLSHTHSKVLHLLNQVKYLSPVYHVVIANPPYMGGKGMNEDLKKFVSTYYKDAKSDLMTCFMDIVSRLNIQKGISGFINLPSWMFISTFEDFRSRWLKSHTIISLLHLGRGVFGADFGTVACVFYNKEYANEKGSYFKLFQKSSIVDSNENKSEMFRKKVGLYLFSQKDFFKLPGAPMAFWLSQAAIGAYTEGQKLGDVCYCQPGLQTSNNAKFVRQWHEVKFERIGIGYDNSLQAAASNKKWFPYLKGGQFRKWYGNIEHVVDWEDNGKNIKEYVDKKYPYLNGNIDYVVKDRGYYFKKLITYTAVTIGDFAARSAPNGFLFDVAGSSIFPEEENYNLVLAFMCSKLALYFTSAQNPTVNLQSSDIANLPLLLEKILPHSTVLNALADEAIKISKNDWDLFERSWDFQEHVLVKHRSSEGKLRNIYDSFILRARQQTVRLKEIEEEINSILIKIYNLEDVILPDVFLSSITLDQNYIFGETGEVDEVKQNIEFQLKIVKELISYSVGCMFGRYNLDKAGLQIETAAFSKTKNSNKSNLTVAVDNVVPVFEVDWFSNNIVEQFSGFLSKVFGEENLEDNILFIEGVLGKDLSKYFTKDFYSDHIKTYNKRPIYWMFSSSKGTFNALIYMHRYTPDTVSIVLNSYLREFRTKLASKRENLERLSADASASARDKTAAVKEIEQLKKMIVELDEYEKDILYPLATQRLEIDLDDGVKANYAKFGKALKPIKGLDKDED